MSNPALMGGKPVRSEPFHSTEIKDFILGEGKKLILVERGADARRLIMDIGAFGGSLKTLDVVIVADSPGAIYEFDKAGINYFLPEEYYSPEEVFDLTSQLKGKILTFLNAFDAELQSLVPYLKSTNLTPAMFDCHRFVILFNSLAVFQFKLNKIIRKEKPNAIAVFNPGAQGQVNEEALLDSFIWHNEENLYYEILKEWKSAAKVCAFSLCNTETLEKAIQGAEGQRITLNLKKKLIRSFPGLASLLMVLAVFGPYYYLRKNKHVIHINGLYGWRNCRDALKTHKIIISRITFDEYFNETGHTLGGIYEKIIDSKSLRDLFVFEDIDVFPILESRLRFYIQYIVPNSMASYKWASKYIDAKGIRAVLFSVIPSSISKSMCCAARNRKIPVIGWHHGPYHIKDTIFSIDYDDFLVSDYFLTYGKDSERLCRTNADLFGCKLITTGSAMLDFLRDNAGSKGNKNMCEILGINKASKDLNIILYAVAPYYFNNQYNATFPPFSPNLLYMTQKRMINGLKDITSCIKIIKLHPSKECNVQEVRDLIADQNDESILIISNQKSIIDLLPYVSCVIVDQPQTVVIQAIAAGLPVFALLNHLKLDAFTETLLRQRVVCQYSPEELLSSVKAFIDTGVYGADIHDEQYLKEYGTYLNDGNSAERAAGVLAGLI